MELLRRLDVFHKSKRGYFAFGVVELIIAYIFISIALDTANMWAYLAGLVFSIGTMLNVINFFTAKNNKKGRISAKNGR